MIDKRIRPFKFWCQKVLPLVYDDSLSYYELLNKIVIKLNEAIGAANDMILSFEQLKQYVDDYFDNLDVSEEIKDKLDKMAQDGTLASIINEEIFGELNTKINDVDNDVKDVVDKRYYITPEMFGAKRDGITDDSDAIQAAIDSLLTVNKGKTLVFNNGLYIVNSTIYFWGEISGVVVFNNSELRTQSKDIDIFYCGYPKNSSTRTKNGIVGPVTFNCMGLARSGLRVHGDSDNACFTDINVINVSKYGILCDSSSNNTEKNFFNNIEIHGVYSKLNDTESVGMEIRSWDTIVTGIATFSIAGGINMSGAQGGGGGIVLVNHHHWQNTAKYDNLADYQKGYGIQLYRGQITNLYYDCGIGVIGWGNNGDINIDNIHMECSNKNKIDWYTENVMILNRDRRNRITLGSHYMVGGGSGTELYVYRDLTGLNTVGTNRVGLQTAVRTTASIPEALATVDESNELFTVFKPKGVFVGFTNSRINNNCYLIGYVQNSGTYTGYSNFYFCINRSFYNVVIDHRQGAAIKIYTKDVTGENTNYGALAIDVDGATTINGINVWPLYYVPGYNSGALSPYALVDIAPIANCGVGRIFIMPYISTILNAPYVASLNENAQYAKLYIEE